MEKGILNEMISRENNYHSLNKNLFIFLIIFILAFLSIRIPGEKIRYLINYSAQINLVIEGSGNQNLIYNSFYLEPSEVIVNGISQSSCKKTCQMDYEKNNVTLYFNEPVTSCYYMFNKLTNIKEIDLSNFDFSNVANMSNMFRSCTNLEKINFGNINTTSVKDLSSMFYKCSNLKSIDLSKFNTKNVQNFESLFNQCTTLTSLDISNFDTSRVTNMYLLFKDCHSLKTIKLGNWNTSSVMNMEALFFKCMKLESIDISSFNATLVTSTWRMFYNCFSLTSIRFPETFNTFNVQKMEEMFFSCISLTNLNLSGFDTRNVTNFNSVFESCISLKYLNIPHFYSLNPQSINKMFRNLTSLVYLNIYSFEIDTSTTTNDVFLSPNSNLKICANGTKMKNYISTQNSIKNKNNCSDICFKDNIKLDMDINECIYSCKENGYNYEMDNICYHQCPNRTHIIIRNISYKNNLFDEYGDGMGLCLNINPEGYYLDEDGFFNNCFETCKICNGPGNEKDNNCTICKTNYFFLNDSFYKNSCYLKCPFYYYFNETYDYICTEKCSGTFNKFIQEKRKCVDNCQKDDKYIYDYNNTCLEKCPENVKIYEDEKICLDECYSYQFEYHNICYIDCPINTYRIFIIEIYV